MLEKLQLDCLCPILQTWIQNESCQVQGNARIEGGIQDADTVGTIVWAKSPSCNGVWWPAEVVDPFYMPFSHMLPSASIMGESKQPSRQHHIMPRCAFGQAQIHVSRLRVRNMHPE